MLPVALDALANVMEARCKTLRIEKEKQAVLSKMTMVNTIEYHVECQILGTCHRENRLAKQFPIGKEVLIRKWDRDDVRVWHRTHYRPDNVLLYVVGDLDAANVERAVRKKFGHLTAKGQGREIRGAGLREEALMIMDVIMGGTIKQAQSWHYPPVWHNFVLEGGSRDVLEEARERGRLLLAVPPREGGVKGRGDDGRR
jgi:hypothetical protein